MSRPQPAPVEGGRRGKPRHSGITEPVESRAKACVPGWASPSRQPHALRLFIAGRLSALRSRQRAPGPSGRACQGRRHGVAPPSHTTETTVDGAGCPFGSRLSCFSPSISLRLMNGQHCIKLALCLFSCNHPGDPGKSAKSVDRCGADTWPGGGFAHNAAAVTAGQRPHAEGHQGRTIQQIQHGAPAMYCRARYLTNQTYGGGKERVHGAPRVGRVVFLIKLEFQQKYVACADRKLLAAIEE